MKALLQAELLKLRSTRTTAGLLLATLGLVALTVASACPEGRSRGGRRSPWTTRAFWPTWWGPVSAFPKC